MMRRYFPLVLALCLAGCTKIMTVPEVETRGSEVASDRASVTLSGAVVDDGNDDLTDCGICYVTGGSTTPTVSDACLRAAVPTGGKGSFRAVLEEVRHNVDYSYRAYAVNRLGTAYGDVQTFRVDAHAPVVTTEGYTMGADQVMVDGNVTNPGELPVTECGICYVQGSGTPTVSGSHVGATGYDGSAAFSFSVKLMGLQYDKLYTYRAYATNAYGTSYGATRTFTMRAPTPTVTTGTATVNPMSLTAVCTGQVPTSGAAPLTQAGICYKKGTGTPTISSGTVVNQTGAAGTTSCSISVTLTNLEEGTYSYRAYAKNANGTSYGEVRTFEVASSGTSVTFGSVSWTDSYPSVYWNHYDENYGQSLQFITIGTLPSGNRAMPSLSFHFTPAPAVSSYSYNLTSLYIYQHTSYDSTYTYLDCYPHYNNQDYYYYHPVIYYNFTSEYNNSELWCMKSGTLNILQFDTVNMEISYTLNAVMFRVADVYVSDGTCTNWNSATTRNLSVSCYRAQIWGDNDKKLSPEVLVREAIQRELRKRR